MRTADIYVFGKLAGALTENDDGLGDSLVSDEFASGFVRLVRANLDRIA